MFMFVMVLTRKTAKSRKKAVGGSGDCRANSASSGVSSQPKPERSPQPEPLARVKRVSGEFNLIIIYYNTKIF